MKKILSILFCMAVFASAFAQTNKDWNNRNYNNNNPYWDAKTNNNVYQNGHDRDGDYDRDDRRYNPGYQNNNYSVAQRNAVIQRITSDYDYRIQQIYNNRQLSRRDRKNIIENLQAQKAQQINNVYARYNNANVYNKSNVYNGRYER